MKFFKTIGIALLALVMAVPAMAMLTPFSETYVSEPTQVSSIQLVKFKKDRQRSSKRKKKRTLKRKNSKKKKEVKRKKDEKRTADKRNSGTGFLSDREQRDRKLKRKPRSFRRKDKHDLIEGRRHYSNSGYHQRKRSRDKYK